MGIESSKCNIEGNTSIPPKPTDGPGKKETDTIFSSNVTDDFIRLLYSYLIFFIFAFMLVRFQTEPGKRYSHILMITIIYIILTFVNEMIWLFLFTDKLKTNKDIQDKSFKHVLLNNILPITALVFGYIILIDGFRASSGSNNIEYVLKAIATIIFFVSYIYLFYTLVNTLTGGKIGESVKKVMSVTDKDDKDDKITYYDHLIDVLYSLFQPISVLFISVMLYYIIKMTYSSGGGQMVPVQLPNPVANPSTNL